MDNRPKVIPAHERARRAAHQALGDMSARQDPIGEAPSGQMEAASDEPKDIPPAYKTYGDEARRAIAALEAKRDSTTEPKSGHAAPDAQPQRG